MACRAAPWAVAAVAALVLPVAALADPEIRPGRDAGAEAAERGWWGVARREWRMDAARGSDEGGSGVAATADDRQRATAAAARLTRLDTVERAFAERAAARDAAVARRVAAEWSIAWRTTTAARPPAAGIAIAAGLVLWNSGRGVHGVSLDDGRPPWHVAADARDSTIFPRGLAAAGRSTPAAATPAATMAAPPPCVVGSRAYAVVALGDGSERLLRVDLSPAAEGRLVWSVAAADVTPAVARAERRAGRTTVAGTVATVGASFDGQPMADHELCLTVLRAVPDRGGLFLAAFATADGRLAWVRPAGRSRAATGDDLARGRRRPCLAEDRIAIVTHAGEVLAFTRDGTRAWTTATPAPPQAAPPASPPDAAAVAAVEPAAPPSHASPPADTCIFAGGRIVAAPRDTTGVVAFDPWSGAVAWHWSRAGETVEQVIGAAGDGVLVATTSAAAASRVRRLAIHDGGELADHASGPRDDGRQQRAGPGTLVDATLVWPTAARPPDAAAAGDTAIDAAGGGDLVLEVLDARTLERRREPLRLAAGRGGGVALTGVADAAAGTDGIHVACAVGAELTCLRPAPPATVQP